MQCEFTFLSVGNADSIIIYPEGGPSVLVDLPQPRAVFDWLVAKGDLNVACIYITHAHKDHFAPLVEFAAFLEQWFNNGGTAENLFIGPEIIEEAAAKLATLKKSPPGPYQRLKHALDSLESWRETKIHWQQAVREPRTSYSSGPLRISVLHPEYFYAVKHRATLPGKHNERSVVLRVTYDLFAALLLADLEGKGIVECLRLCAPQELSAHLVKIPHHGAWPTNGADLEELLRRIDAEVAVLSVGSQNIHRHVTSELFSLLLELQNDPASRLQKFICTEVTRTCALSLSERSGMGRSGLPSRLPCAGDITIIADNSGTWTLRTATNHALQISGVKYAACLGHAEL